MKDAHAHPDPKDRSDQTSHKLLLASIDVFGRLGFEGTSTRALAQAAGVNLQAIPYYFGGKQGLYLAAADHIAAEIGKRVGPVRDSARAILMRAAAEDRPLLKTEARGLISAILRAMAEVFLDERSEAWARVMMREQMQPTEAFARIYGGVMKPMLEIIQRLLASLLDDDPQSDAIKLRSLALVGNVMIFRVAHAAVCAQMGWTTFGRQQVEAIQALLDDLVSTIGISSKDAQ